MDSLPPAMGITDVPLRRPPGAGAAPARWVYVDSARSHEIHAGLRQGSSLEFFVREIAHGLDDPEAAYESAFPVDGAWEARFHQLALEERLSLLGTYYRHTHGSKGWGAVARSPPGKTLDLAPLDADVQRGAVELHYYGTRADARSVLLVSILRDTPKGRRHRLARLEFDFPEVEKGDCLLLHPGLPQPVYRSLLAHHHLDLTARGMQKLVVVNRHLPSNARWFERLETCLTGALARIEAGRFGKGQLRPRPLPRLEGGPRRALGGAPSRLAPPPGPAAGGSGGGSGGSGTDPDAIASAFSGAPGYEIEDPFPAAPVPSPSGPPQPTIEEVQTDLMTALTNPRLLALHGRFLTTQEQAECQRGGELAIRQVIKGKRVHCDPAQQHLLSLVEASLLTRHALSSHGRIRADPMMVDLLRRSLIYL